MGRGQTLLEAIVRIHHTAVQLVESAQIQPVPVRHLEARCEGLDSVMKMFVPVQEDARDLRSFGELEQPSRSPEKVPCQRFAPLM